MLPPTSGSEFRAMQKRLRDSERIWAVCVVEGGVAAEYKPPPPPHSITLRYDHTAKHYLGGKLLVIIKLNCTENFYPKSANTAENAVNL